MLDVLVAIAALGGLVLGIYNYFQERWRPARETQRALRQELREHLGEIDGHAANNSARVLHRRQLLADLEAMGSDLASLGPRIKRQDIQRAVAELQGALHDYSAAINNQSRANQQLAAMTDPIKITEAIGVTAEADDQRAAAVDKLQRSNDALKQLLNAIERKEG